MGPSTDLGGPHGLRPTATWLRWFPKAVIAKHHHRLGSWKQQFPENTAVYSLPVPGARSLKAKRQQAETELHPKTLEKVPS